MKERARALMEKAIQQWSEEKKTTLPESFFPEVERTENEVHGDYATNAAMRLARVVKKNPIELAKAFATSCSALDTRDDFERIEAVGGYVNFFISRRALNETLFSVLEEGDEFGNSDEGKGKTIIIEYFQLNAAKRPHVGHICSALLGDSLKRIIRSRGFRTLSDTHVGDWGTQFGILIAAYKKFGDRAVIEREPLEELEKLYIKYHEAMEEAPSLREIGKEEFAKLEAGDKENRKLWEWFNKVSMRKLHEMSALLGLEPFNLHLGESFYEDKQQVVLDELLQKGVAKEGTKGAVIADLSEWGLDDAVARKSDGASTYLLRDLAKLRYVWGEYRYFRNIYVVDSRQEHHFKQVFKVAELLGWGGVKESVHVSYGFMKLPTGMLSTREGNIVKLEAVVHEAKARAKKIIEQKNPNLKDKERTAYLVGLAALKYFNLAHNPKSDITFVWEEALNFEGNSGPYLEYTHARIHGILRKAGKEANEAFKTSSFADVELDLRELRLLRHITRFGETIDTVAKEYAPHKLCLYLFELAQAFNAFYQEVPVMKEDNKTLRAFRLGLIRGVAQTMKNGLSLLGIEPLDEM